MSQENSKVRIYVVSIHTTSGRCHIERDLREHIPTFRSFLESREVSVEIDEARAVASALIHEYPPPTFLYVGVKGRSIYKVGITRDLDERAAKLGIEILATETFYQRRRAIRFERKLHKLYKMQGKHIRGEWFRLTQNDVHWIATLHKYEQWDNEYSLDDKIETAKRVMPK